MSRQIARIVAGWWCRCVTNDLHSLECSFQSLRWQLELQYTNLLHCEHCCGDKHSFRQFEQCVLHKVSMTTWTAGLSTRIVDDGEIREDAVSIRPYSALDWTLNMACLLACFIRRKPRRTNKYSCFFKRQTYLIMQLEVLVAHFNSGNNVHVRDTADVTRKLEILVSGGASKVHLVSDFDRTLTRYYSINRRYNSI